MIKPKAGLNYFTKNLLTIIGIVLTWRGVWYVLDELDKLMFGGSHTSSLIHPS